MILFFLNRFNDIDHIVPIIHRVAQESEYKITIVALNLFIDIQSDFRIKFIKNKYPNILIVDLLPSVSPLPLRLFFKLIPIKVNLLNYKINFKSFIR